MHLASIVAPVATVATAVARAAAAAAITRRPTSFAQAVCTEVPSIQGTTLLCARRAGVVVLAHATAVCTVAMRSTLDSVTLVKMLATISRVRRTLTYAGAIAVSTAAVDPTVDRGGKFAWVHLLLAHGSAVACVALAHAADARAVRSAAVHVLANTLNIQAEDEWRPRVSADIDYS